MIPALGAGGREFDSRITPFFLLFQKGRIAQSVERWSNKPLVMGIVPTFFCVGDWSSGMILA